MAVRITCITKDNGNHENPHAAIQSLGWIEDGTAKQGTSTRLQMYDWIKNQSGHAYVRDRSGNTARVGTAETSRGTKYIRTFRDGTWTDNLLALSEC